jgi:hypothetical protein
LTSQSPGFTKLFYPLLGIAAFSAILLWAVVFRGRGGQGFTGSCAQATEQIKDKGGKLKTNLDVQIGIDGSESMLGFVKNESSRYITVIDKLDDLLRESNLKADLGSSIDNAEVNYFRLGAGGPGKLKEKARLGIAKSGKGFLDAKFPRFYCDGNTQDYPCVSSALHQIFMPESKPTSGSTTEPAVSLPDAKEISDTMWILITDLEPDNGASGQITEQISKIFNQHPDYKAILLGIRSEFNGPIYSADRPSNSKSYQSRGDVLQNGRPFYLFVVGPSTVVQTFVKGFMDRVGKDMAETIRASAFQRQESPILLNIPSDFKTPDCTQRKYNLLGKRLTQESEWLALSERKCDKQPPDRLQLEIPSQQSWLLRGGSFSADSFGISRSFAKVNNVDLDSNTDQPFLKLTINIAEKESRSSEQPIYITLKERELDEIIWKDWSIPINSLEGQKTQKLIDFVQSVRGKASQGHAHDAIRFCLGYAKQ